MSDCDSNLSQRYFIVRQADRVDTDPIGDHLLPRHECLRTVRSLDCTDSAVRPQMKESIRIGGNALPDYRLDIVFEQACHLELQIELI